MSTEKASVSASRSVEELELTPAASELIDEYVTDLRRRVEQELIRIRSRNAGTIRMGDVRAAIRTLERKNSGATTRILGKYRAIIATLAVTCGLSLIIAAVYLLAKSSVGDDVMAIFPAIVAIIATTVSALSAGIAVQGRAQRVRQRATYAYIEFLQAFSYVEQSARRLAADRLGISAENTSLGVILSAIASFDAWTRSDVEQFRGILSLRNALVHERKAQPNADELIDATRQLNRLQELIDSVEKRRTPGRSRQHQIASFSYEQRLARALRSIVGGEVAETHREPYDFLIETPDASVFVAAKHFVSGRTFGLVDLKKIVERFREHSTGALLVVTDAPFSSRIREYIDSMRDQDFRIEVAHWSDEPDNDRLRRAISDVISAATDTST